MGVVNIMIFDRQQLETFSVVVELRKFDSAAKALHVTRGAVSQRIIALEQALGTPVLVRDGNVPTPAGEAVLRHVRTLKLMEADTLNQIKPDTNGRTNIAVAVNADSLATWFEPVACTIAKENFALELIVDDQDFTLPVLIRGEAIGGVSTLHNILAAPAVLFNRKDGLHAEFLERLLGFPVRGYAVHYFPSPVALLMAVRAGVGYGLVPSMQVQPLIDSGELVALAPRSRVFVNLYWHHWENAPPNAKRISEIVMQYARQALIQSPEELM
jgi:LysR family transcriptional regulator (chromosome initiation inhibitor)